MKPGETGYGGMGGRTEEAVNRLRESGEAACAAEERLVGILKQEGRLVS